MYYINEWAKVRRDEMVDIPYEIDIHNDFLKYFYYDDFNKAFRYIWKLFYRIYDDISVYPEKFKMPLVNPDEYRYGSLESGRSRSAAWLPIKLLYYISICSEFRFDHLSVDLYKFKTTNNVKQIHTLLEPLSVYGFVFDGLKNFKILKSTTEFNVYYPGNEKVLAVLNLVAKKCENVNRGVKANDFKNDFYSWNYRILADSFNTVSHDENIYYIYDKMHNDADRDFIIKFDKIMDEMGYYANQDAWNEGPGLRYYDRENYQGANVPYLFKMMSWKSKLILYLRIRNADRCLSYVKSNASDAIKEMFRKPEVGCGNRVNCKSGVKYTFEGEEKWRCGCSAPAFRIQPDINDIQHYINLVKLGAKR